MAADGFVDPEGQLDPEGPDPHFELHKDVYSGGWQDALREGMILYKIVFTSEELRRSFLGHWKWRSKIIQQSIVSTAVCEGLLIVRMAPFCIARRKRHVQVYS